MFRSSRARRLILAVCLLTALVMQAPDGARAHSDLASASPAPNQSVVEPPSELRLTFTEPVDPDNFVVVLLDTQQRSIRGLGTPDASADGLTVTISLPDLDSGVFTVSYQVVSRTDGHATAGSYAFLVDPTGAGPPPANSAVEVSPSVDGYTLSARWLALLALLVSLGSVLMWRFSALTPLRQRGIDPAPPWAPVGATALLSAASLAAYLWLAARPIPSPGTGLPLDVAGAFGWTPFAIAMRVTIIIAAVAGLAAFVAARRGASGWWPAIAVLLSAALAGMSLAGHVAATGGPAFAALDWGHLIGVAAWLGGLPTAVILARRPPSDRARLLRGILRRHGRLALVAAPLVVITGVANSPLVLGRGRDLVASDYGNLLVAKAMLAAVALGIGAVNHLALRGRGRANLGLLLGVELVVAATAVGAAATMVTIQPASARAPIPHTAPVAPAHFSGSVGGIHVHLAVSLPAPGIQSYRLTTGRTDPEPELQKAFLVFHPPVESGLPDERVELEPDEQGGLWTASGTYTPVVGDWTLDLILRQRGLLDESTTFELRVLEPGAAEVGPARDTGIGVPAPLGATWDLLPGGVAGWLPALVILAGLGLASRLPPTVIRDGVRGAGTALLVIAVLSVGSRDLVDAANQPAEADLAGSVGSGGADLATGRSIYLANCASCHGTELDGGGPVHTVPPAGSLAEFVGSASDAELSYRISYGVAGTAMPAFAGSLTAAERRDLYGYLRAATESR